MILLRRTPTEKLLSRVVAENPKCTRDIIKIASNLAHDLDIKGKISEEAHCLYLGACAFEVEGGNIRFEEGVMEICKRAYGCGQIIKPFFDAVWSGYWLKDVKRGVGARHYAERLNSFVEGEIGDQYTPKAETIIKICEEDIPIFSSRKRQRRTEEGKIREQERLQYRKEAEQTLREKYSNFIGKNTSAPK